MLKHLHAQYLHLGAIRHSLGALTTQSISELVLDGNQAVVLGLSST